MIWEGAILGVYVIVKGFNSKRAAELEGRAPATAPATAPGAGRRLTTSGPGERLRGPHPPTS